MNRQEEIIKSAIDIFVKALNPAAIYLFGSRASATAGKHSDFDFALECEKPEANLRRKIAEEINHLAGLYKVDIVYLTDAEADFQIMVRKTGKLIYGRKS
ncbi:nucleotidyltransferase domain-containing protein [Candidatus Saganbacteria bacterium]|nr:nucleotidyltransferase domain-containing protein [Candidatus Saganbacteria bacterium]